MRGTPAELLPWILNGADEGKVYEVTEWRPKRTLSQNNYFHALIDKMAEAHTLTIGPMTPAAMKNTMLGRYGKKMRTANDEPLVIKTNMRPEDMIELEEPHTKLARENEDGTFSYWWLQRTKEMDVREMAALLTATVEEAKALGVETMTPRELEELRRHEIQKQAQQGD